MPHVLAVFGLGCWLLEQERGHDCLCLHRDALFWGPLAVGYQQVSLDLRELCARAAAWEVEDVLAPLRYGLIRLGDVPDDLVNIFGAPLELWCWR